jgi:hypothetical protein
MLKGLSPFISFLVFVLFVGLIVASSVFWFNQVASIQKNIDSLKSDIGVLENNLSVLQKVTGDVLSLADTAAVALPFDDPLAIVISQMRSQAKDLNINLINLKLKSGQADVGDNLHQSEIEFDVEGTLSSLITYLERIKNSSPLTYMENVQIDPYLNNFRATITLSSFWADLPDKLPSLEEPITDLGSSEKDIMAKLSAFERPQFIELAPATPSARANPFSL